MRETTIRPIGFDLFLIFFYKKQAWGASSTKPAPVNDAGPVSDDKIC